MNFPYRDRFGEVNEAERKKHLSESTTVDSFIQYSKGKTLKELQFSGGPAKPAKVSDIEISEQGLGPKGHRYLRDVHNPGRVIDMRHFLESADIPFGFGEPLGAAIEVQQGTKNFPSAHQKEDYNSNFLGAVFRNNYYDPDKEISKQFQEFFTDYEKRELKGFAPAAEYLISDVIDLAKDGKRALEQLGDKIDREIDRLEKLGDSASKQLKNRLKNALDKLISSVDQPVYAEEIEAQFEQAENQIQRQYYDPLILDLDGNGVELTSTNDLTVRFDIDGDGFREATGWVKPQDGFLVLDRNNDGHINDISELFGNQNTSGFDELKELDSNNDGQITADDANFAQLQIWRDLDQNGYSSPQELFTLEDYDIVKIDATGNAVSISNNGNLINEIASFEFADGTQHQVANVLFDIDQQNSYYDPYSTFNSEITFTEQIFTLPNLRGYGNLPDLRIAMAKDSELVALVESFAAGVNSGDISAASELMRPILIRWAGVNVSNLSSNSFYAFDYELEFLEKFVGRAWNNSNPSAAGRTTIRNTFAQLESELKTRLLAQIAESPVIL
ncbi:hypothetical protein [Pleurocapsa sp. PCC 7319]|uniref:hypothetical protein n=1 Tax=Pleurocapsa sp. PCC 7319 TaxID=118161 RepID=UPI00034815FF|nr:hypothetical protein [Pleurocapsa sp. PCC 7319]